MDRRRIYLVLILALCGCASAPRGSDTQQTLRLPIRFHLLTSRTSAALTTTRTEQDVRTLAGVANTIWKQAGIEWYVESIVWEESPSGAEFDSLLAGQIPRTEANLTAFVPRDHLLRPGWNVFLIRDFGRIAGGMFRPELGGVVLAERGFGFALPVAGRGGATLAHELGHSLMLGHVPCDSTHDIMANACWSPSVVSNLTPAQIAQARQQARTGHPASIIPSP
jgi:hypothetical protein